jgi:hypothetical protein
VKLGSLSFILLAIACWHVTMVSAGLLGNTSRRDFSVQLSACQVGDECLNNVE